jgi:hypothetical protein
VAEKETHSANTRTHLKIPGWHRNFILRPPRPAKGNGRLQKIARRLLAIHGTASTSDLISWAYRKPLWRKGERSKVQFNIAARYAMRTIGATAIGRAKTRGRPWLWQLRDASPAVPEPHSNREQRSDVNGLAGRSR